MVYPKIVQTKFYVYLKICFCYGFDSVTNNLIKSWKQKTRSVSSNSNSTERDPIGKKG